MRELRYMGRGIQDVHAGKEILNGMNKAVRQPTTKSIMVVHFLRELSVVYESAVSIARVVDKPRSPLSYTRESEDRGVTRNGEDVTKGEVLAELADQLWVFPPPSGEGHELRGGRVGEQAGKLQHGEGHEAVGREEVLEDSDKPHLPTLVPLMYWKTTSATNDLYCL